MPRPTQEFLEVESIREGIVILKNKTFRGILMVSSMNLALKSEEEQNAVIYQFQDFLNSLDFSCQIIVQTRRLNITSYIDKLKALEERQENELLAIQTAGYREFIESLVKAGTIMSKHFYVVVPFYLSELQGEEKKKKKFGLLAQSVAPTITEKMFQRCKTQLWQRMEFISLGLRRCGLKSAMLTTPEIVELLWTLYHPRQAETGYYPEIPPELSK